MSAPAIGREQAIAALMHRLNGGLHNAALALELAADGAGKPALLHGGLAGVHMASRAAALLNALIRDRAPDDPSGAYTSDVVDLLRIHASQRTIELRASGIDPSASALTAHAAVQALVDGIAAIARASAGVPLQLEFVASGQAPALRVMPAAS